MSILDKRLTKKYSFELEINGLIQGKVQKVDLPEQTRDTATYSTGTDKYLTKVPMRPQAGQATLTGLVLASEKYFYDWFSRADKRLVFIRVLDDEGRVARRYELIDTYPASTKTEELDATNTGELLMETLTLEVKEVKIR